MWFNKFCRQLLRNTKIHFWNNWAKFCFQKFSVTILNTRGYQKQMRKAEKFYYKFFFLVISVLSHRGCGHTFRSRIFSAEWQQWTCIWQWFNTRVPAHLEAALGQQEASQLRLYSPRERKKVRKGDFWQIGRVADCVWLQGTPGQRKKCGLSATSQFRKQSWEDSPDLFGLKIGWDLDWASLMSTVLTVLPLGFLKSSGHSNSPFHQFGYFFIWTASMIQYVWVWVCVWQCLILRGIVEQQFHSCQCFAALASIAMKLSAEESLQSPCIHTKLHWSSGPTVCFLSWGARVQIPGGVLLWNRNSHVSVVSLQCLRCS